MGPFDIRCWELWVDVMCRALMGSFCCKWCLKRFLHPNIVEPYDYIFIWDKDLDVTHFDAKKYALTQNLICVHMSLSFWLDTELG